ncbi:Manganese transporter smf1 [Rhodotorula kratochvilovae]
MQGPVLASHRSGHYLPALIPPRQPDRTSQHSRVASDLADDTAKTAIPEDIPLAQLDTPPIPPPNLPQEGREIHAGDLEAGDDDAGQVPSWSQRILKALKRHAAFVGPGVIASVAYLDPGNWSTDLAAGSQFGYSHLFIILFAGLVALLFQILSTRLGCVSDYDLATHCRFALHDRDSRYKLAYRWGLLYPLYVMAEIGIIFTDLAELLGSAIAINLLIPAIPLWGAVVLTSADVFLILLLFNQYPTRTVTRSMRIFELLIGVLVLCVLAAFVALLVKVSPVWKDVFYGYVPRSGIVRGGGIYIAVGIVGATVMPHAFYIGSKMATMRRLKPEDYGESSAAYEGGDAASDDEYDDDDAWQKKRDAQRAATAEAAPDRRSRAQRVGDAVASPFSSAAAARRRGGADASPPRPYFPSLHFPQPVSLGALGLDLGALTRPRSPAQDRRRARGGDEIEEVDAEHGGEAGEDGKDLGRTTSAAMDDVAMTGSSAADAAQKDGASSSRSRPRRKPTLACVQAHLTHASLDIAGSLLGFAVVVNSAILILGAAVFYYGEGRSSNPDGGGVSDLFDAYELVKQYLGQAFAYLFAIALLAAGQSASLTVTLSGQIVSEGFINWRTKPWKRRLITRCIGIVPSLAVAISVGRQGIDTLLVASQVALSIVLTFVLMPLIIFCAQQSVMSIPIDPHAPPAPSPAKSEGAALSRADRLRRLARDLNPLRRRRAPEGTVSYASPVWLVWVCSALWLLIGIANVYALYDVGQHGA